MEFSWNPDTSCKEKLQSSISTHPFPDIPSFSQFSLTCITHQCGKRIFNLGCSHYYMNWIYAFLHMPQFPTQNSRYNFLKICFPQGPRTKGWRKLWFAFLKFNQKIWRWHGTLVHVYVVWFIIFLNVMALLFCE